MNNEEVKNLLDEVYELVDPKKGTPFEKSRTAFISFNVKTGSITFSVFLARTMGVVSGDRIAFINSKKEPLKWFVAKVRQRNKTKPMRITKSRYHINSRDWTDQIGSVFRFNFNQESQIRLFVNMEDPIVFTNFENAIGLQLFDIPSLRTDFATDEEKQEYTDWIMRQQYIVKLTKPEEKNGN